MSAITGIFNLHDDPAVIEHGGNLMQSLQKYPADDIQVWHKGKVFLGCHAQWITPESAGEQLPYYDYNRQLVITADAIIDNREELFEKLQIYPTTRKIMTDSELILLAYDKWGDESPKHLVGDFAFMIWDEKNNRLFGARDFSGSRTLYYCRTSQQFAFCTTIEPLFTLPNVHKRLNEQWLAQFLAITAVVDTVDASITPYKHIEQVPPSHSISIAGHIITLKRYNILTSGEQLKLKSDEEYVDAFQEVFQTAVKSRLRTNRQVGSHLSGGLDSGSVVSFAVKQLRTENKQLHSFSYIPPKDFKDFTARRLMADERPFIQSTVAYVGGITPHYLDFEGRNSFSDIDDYLEIMEMPYKFFENSFWIKGIFEKAHEEGIGVLLTGARGNLTISWGNALQHYAHLFKRMKWIRLIRELHLFSQNTGGARFSKIPVIARIAFPMINNIFPIKKLNNNLPGIINPDFAKRTDVYNQLRKYGMDETGWLTSTSTHELRNRHFEDVCHWNASNTLSTKLSLRYKLWMRDPTNDLRVAKFCLSVPEEQYVQNGLDRALIRRSTKHYLPDKVRLNQRVRGIQGADWVHRMIPLWDTFIEELQELSADKQVLQFINGSSIQSALVKVKEGARPECANDTNYLILMRSLIVYKYIKQFA